MDCPYCERELRGLAWEYWSGSRKERFELICPGCGNNVVVVARLSFDIHKHEENNTQVRGMFNGI